MALPADQTGLEGYLSASAYNDLKTLLAEEEDAYTFASIRSEDTFETVKLTLSADTVVMERGYEGTAAVMHPCGSLVCLVSPTTVAAIKALICEYDCCKDGDCECDAAAYAGAVLPAATVNKAWSGGVLFTGKLPMTFGVNGQPEWMEVSSEGSVLSLEGTPTSTGTYIFSVAAANCNGTAVATQTLVLTVDE